MTQCGPVQNPPVVFDYGTWIGLFPEFSPLTAAQGNAYFTRATGSFAANSCTNPAYCAGNLAYLLYLATSHIAWLNCPKDTNGNPAATGTPAAPLVGRVSSATEGSVTVSLEFPTSGDDSQLAAFFNQTKYGAEYWAAMAPYRTARYLARPTIVINGLLPGLWNSGGYYRGVR